MHHKLSRCNQALLVLLASVALSRTAIAQDAPRPLIDQKTAEDLLNRLAADEARIKELEDKLSVQAAHPAAPPSKQADSPSVETAAASPVAPATAPAPVDVDASEAMNSDLHAHTMEMGGGPSLKVRGYFDVDF